MMDRSRNDRVCRGMLALAACASLATSADGQVPLTLVVTSGSPAPGFPAGVSISGFSSVPVINNQGQTAFTGLTSNGSYGVFSNTSGALALVARPGAGAPVTPPQNYSQAIGTLLSDNGKTGLTGILSSCCNEIGVFSGVVGSVAEVARTSQPAPGLPAGSTFESPFAGPADAPLVTSPVMNSIGQTAFFAGARDAEALVSRYGVWSEGTGSLGPVALTGWPAPGLPTGTQFGDTIGQALNNSSVTPVINDRGDVAFNSTLAGPGVIAANNRAVWAQRSGSLALVARSDSPAPGGGPNVVFDRFDSPTINNDSHTAFKATLMGAGVTENDDEAIFAESGGLLHAVAREGAPAPGTPPDVRFLRFGNRPLLTGIDRVFFDALVAGAGVSGANDQGLWMETSGAVSVLVREGDPAAGMDTDVRYAAPASGIGYTANALGQAAFLMDLTGPGISPANDRAIWAIDGLGQILLVAREGQSVEIATGVFRTIAGLSLPGHSGGEDGEESMLNDVGQLVFAASFSEGGSGLFVASIPEPSVGGLLALAVLCSRRRRRPIVASAAR